MSNSCLKDQRGRIHNDGSRIPNQMPYASDSVENLMLRGFHPRCITFDKDGKEVFPQTWYCGDMIARVHKRRDGTLFYDMPRIGQ